MGRVFKAALLCSGALGATAALSQSVYAPGTVPSVHPTSDAFGVDLTTGLLTVTRTDIAVGPSAAQGGLAYTVSDGFFGENAALVSGDDRNEVLSTK